MSMEMVSCRERISPKVSQKVNNVVRKGPDGKMQIERVPIPAIREDLAQIIEENK